MDQSRVDLNRFIAQSAEMGALSELYAAVAKSNMPAGGGVIQKNNAEYLVRFVGWIKDKRDIENTIIRPSKGGTPLRVGDVATVQLGQQFRRTPGLLGARGGR